MPDDVVVVGEDDGGSVAQAALDVAPAQAGRWPLAACDTATDDGMCGGESSIETVVAATA